jgi:CubicO group peptidase (beta-lactamase class C family)
MYYSNKKTDSSLVQVADGMYLKNRWLDSLWQRTKEVGVSGRKVSQYTDLNMILVQITIDTINRSNMNRYMQKEFYAPLGLKNIMYQPRQNRVPLNRIAPTENDRTWRRQVVHGHVHDPSAAMLGGISGNAGLFASAEDLGVLFQMLLNGGTYGGRRYLSENIIRLFTTTNEETGRGLGFDKWGNENIVAPSASPNTYGHTGFTGCCVWVDPDSKLVFVFLSNRVHPNVNNHRINGLKIRQKVHQVFYDAEKTMKN